MPQKPPDTLPADFFSSPQHGSAPDTLPADFDFGGAQKEQWPGGVAPPPIAPVKLPPDLRAPTTDPSGFGMSTRNPRTGRQYTERDTAARVPVLDSPVEGAKQMGQGIATMSDPSWERKAHGASQVARGAMEAAAPLLPGAAAAAPLRVGMGLAAGYLASQGTEKGLNAMGVPPGYSEVLGDAAGLAAGTKIARGGGATADAPPPMLSQRLYQSALKPQTRLSPAKRTSIVNTGINEGVPVSHGGLEKTGDLIDGLNADVTGRIADRSQQLGPVISPKSVAQRVDQARPTFEQQVNPAADLSALEASKREFLNKHTDQAPYTKIAPSLDEGGFVPNGEGSTPVERPLTLAEAQAEKVGTYRQLKDKAYGELKSSSIEAQKALARGLKEEVYAQYPELQALGAREGALIDLEGQLERYAARHGNRDAIGIGTPLKMIAGGKVAGMLAGALEFPGVKSRLAIALNRAAQVSRQSNPLPAGIPALPTQRPDEPPPFPAQ